MREKVRERLRLVGKLQGAHAAILAPFGRARLLPSRNKPGQQGDRLSGSFALPGRSVLQGDSRPWGDPPALSVSGRFDDHFHLTAVAEAGLQAGADGRLADGDPEIPLAIQFRGICEVCKVDDDLQ